MFTTGFLYVYFYWVFKYCTFYYIFYYVSCLCKHNTRGVTNIKNTPPVVSGCTRSTLGKHVMYVCTFPVRDGVAVIKLYTPG